MVESLGIIEKGESMYHCAIIGAGAIGGWLAGHIGLQNSVCFVDSRQTVSSQLALSVTSLTKGTIQLDVPVLTQIPDCHWLIICVKAHQVRPAIQHLKIPKDCQVLLMVNGLGAHTPLLSRVDTGHLCLASNTHGVLLQQKTAGQLSVKHTGLGRIDIGSVIRNQAAPEHFNSIQNAIAPLLWQDNIYQALWLKLAVNCCINPLTAIHNCTNGELLQTRYRQQIDALSQELSQVAQAGGINLSSQTLTDTVLMVASNTAHNYSSMQQDIRHHRPSEIDYINGYVVRLAEIHQLPCQHHKALLEQIKLLESHHG
ncbi:ketopantoate reductase family protein [Agarivorans sp. QJM3NY_29]|uniref:ketopantoate reductase family protein n=1 Tax=unclassified Agarivorans TaxID=2636026 RepID=UPI003D7EB254